MAPSTRLSGVLVTLAVTAGAFVLLIPVVSWTRGHEAEQMCRSRLRRVGSGLLVYRGSTEGGPRWPAKRGRGFLTRLIEAGVITDPTLLQCPADVDGAACGYAGWSLRRAPGAPDATTPVACDDDTGRGPTFNHGDRLQVLFSDGHAETRPFEPELPPRIGKGLLETLGH